MGKTGPLRWREKSSLSRHITASHLAIHKAKSSRTSVLICRSLSAIFRIVYILEAIAYWTAQTDPNQEHRPMLIKQSDYHRIYRVINSLLVNENADPATASMFFSTFGAFILNQHFNCGAAPRGGLASYNLGGKVILFADHREDGFVTGAGENFHCWVETDSWALDFMAPAFPQSTQELSMPARMFQKPLSAMAASINDLSQSGEFFLCHEQDAMARRFADWQKHAALGDLAAVAARWFRKSPKQMPASLSVERQNGGVTNVPLAGNMLSGAW